MKQALRKNLYVHPDAYPRLAEWLAHPANRGLWRHAMCDMMERALAAGLVPAHLPAAMTAVTPAELPSPVASVEPERAAPTTPGPAPAPPPAPSPQAVPPDPPAPPPADPTGKQNAQEQSGKNESATTPEAAEAPLSETEARRQAALRALQNNHY